jgi:hypothetical protein
MVSYLDGLFGVGVLAPPGDDDDMVFGDIGGSASTIITDFSGKNAPCFGLVLKYSKRY